MEKKKQKCEWLLFGLYGAVLLSFYCQDSRIAISKLNQSAYQLRFLLQVTTQLFFYSDQKVYHPM